MTRTRRHLSIAIFVVPVLLAFLTRQMAAAPQAQGPIDPGACRWVPLGALNSSVFYATAAVDTEQSAMYVYGGMDMSFETRNTVTEVNFGDTFDSAGTSVRTVAARGALPRMALAAVFRPDGDNSAVYFIGGRDDRGATNTVQVFRTRSREWGRITPAGSFSDRDEHAAAYDPVHDVIWVIAGERQPCSSTPCTAPVMPTVYLSFDAATGEATWEDGPPGGLNRAKGPSLVYDARGRRMIAFGGTPDGSRGTDALWALDLSDPDVTKASWQRLDAAGTGPTAAVHTAAYDPNRNWMVVYGGIRNNYAIPGRESAGSRTWILDLNEEPPVWQSINISLGDRIQAVAGYVDKFGAMVLTSGRQKVADPIQSDFMVRTIHGLVCPEAPTPTAQPTATDAPSPTATATVPPSTATASPTVAPTSTPEPEDLYLPALGNEGESTS